MTRLLSAAFLALLTATSAATADPRKNAEYIVEKTVTPEIMGAVLETMRPLVEQAFRAPFGQGEAARTFSPEAQSMIINALFKEFSTNFVQEMKIITVGIYVEELSPEALAGFANFLSTPAGAEFAAAQPEISRLAGNAGQRAGAAAGARAAPAALRRLQQEGAEIFAPNQLELLERMLLGDSGVPRGKPANK